MHSLLSTWDQNLRRQLRRGVPHLAVELICSWHGAIKVSLCLRGIPQALYHEPLAQVITQALPMFDIKFTFYLHFVPVGEVQLYLVYLNPFISYHFVSCFVL